MPDDPLDTPVGQSDAPQPSAGAATKSSPLDFLKSSTEESWVHPFRRRENGPSKNGSRAQTHECSLAYLSLFLVCVACIGSYLLLIPAIICGHMASGQCRRDPKLNGSSYSAAALLAGYAIIAVLLCTVWLPALVGVLNGASARPAMHFNAAPMFDRATPDHN